MLTKFNLDKDLSQDFFAMLEQAKPAEATSSYVFKWNYLLASFMSKHPGVGGSADIRRQRAIDKMLDANESCRVINETGYRDDSRSFRALIARAATICSITLGDFSHEIWKVARFTSGSTTSRKRRNGDPFFKYHASRKLDATEECRPLAMALIANTPVWRDHGGLDNINIVPGGTVTTAPKNCDIDRGIEQQPDLNALMQKALGLAFDERLKRVGIDIHDQSTNQILAFIGSSDNSLATVDLAAASDSISIRLVRDLIPPVWLEMLERVRCAQGVIKNGKAKQFVDWQLFSSMGNGVTFGLETLIFYALAKAVVEESDLTPCVGTNLAVYGDDIIVPSSVADRLIWVLNACGFTTNKNKTFTDGPFRESCGRHFHYGNDVTPFYVRAPINDLSRVIWFLNSLRKWAYDEDLGMCDPSVYRIWLHIRRKYVPAELLGGESIDDILSVYSNVTTNPSRLRFERITRKLTGWRAYARWFQFQSDVSDVRYAKILTLEEKLHWHVDDEQPQELIRLLPEKVSITRSKTWSSSREMLFPLEVCVTR